MCIWNPEFEQMKRDKLIELQNGRLSKIISYVYTNVPFYKKKMDHADIKPADIKGIDLISKLPFTKKVDFRDNYPTDTFARSLKDIIRIHASSGTSGKPTVVGYTQNDLELWSELIARLAVAGGVCSEDVVQIAFGYGLFTGGFGLHYGCEKIGATIIPASSGNTERQLMLMQDIGTTVLVCTPSYALYLGETIVDSGLKDKLKLKYGLFGGEAWSEDMRKEIEMLLGIKATDNYGLSEIIGPGVSYECLYQDGMHISEDHFYAEIIDPSTGEVLPEGEEGELVITTLSKEALPVIRYRTGDITSIDSTPCSCGRTNMRMRKTKGRSDDMLVIRGVNVFPSQVESVLAEFEHTKPHYQIIVDRQSNLDSFELLVEVSEEILSDNMREFKLFENNLSHRLQSVLGIKVDLKIVEPRTLERYTGKATRIIDKRKF